MFLETFWDGKLVKRNTCDLFFRFFKFRSGRHFVPLRFAATIRSLYRLLSSSHLRPSLRSTTYPSSSEVLQCLIYLLDSPIVHFFFSADFDAETFLLTCSSEGKYDGSRDFSNPRRFMVILLTYVLRTFRFRSTISVRS